MAHLNQAEELLMFLLLPLLIIFLTIGVILRSRHTAKQKQKHIRELRAWSTQSKTLDPVSQQWIQQLSNSESEVLLDLLNGYCASLNWELGWLFTSQIDRAPALKAALEESVSVYARAILLSLQMEDDVRAYHAYLAFEKKPNARKQRALVQQLYRKLNNQNFMQPTRGFFRRFSRRGATHKEQITAIQRAFERDPAFTMAALQEILISEGTSAIRNESQGVSSSAMAAPATFGHSLMSG
ncbi:hypothetical protein KFU94_14730 [Chloroflexi bacterium TSY]|nr:hypothetical protein [Chloroflexi bacterium TSY]